jgi:hypothetical protein
MRQIKAAAQPYTPGNIHRALTRLQAEGWVEPRGRATWSITGHRPAKGQAPSEQLDAIVRNMPPGFTFDVRHFDSFGIDRKKTNATARMGELVRLGWLDNADMNKNRRTWTRTGKNKNGAIAIPRNLDAWAKIWPEFFNLPPLAGNLIRHQCVGG